MEEAWERERNCAMAFMSALAAGVSASRPIGPGRASSSTRRRGDRRSSGLPPARPRCSACGATGRPCTWRFTPRGAEILVISLPCPSGASRPSRLTHPPALRLERTIRDLYGLEPEGSPDTRPWLDHGRWGVADRSAHRRRHPPRATLTRFSRPRAAAAPDPRRAGACRHHRARPFPLHRQRGDRRAPRRALGLRAQGHRGADARCPARAGGEARRPRLGRQHRRLRDRVRAGRRGRSR